MDRVSSGRKDTDRGGTKDHLVLLCISGAYGAGYQETRVKPERFLTSHSHTVSSSFDTDAKDTP